MRRPNKTIEGEKSGLAEIGMGFKSEISHKKPLILGASLGANIKNRPYKAVKAVFVGTWGRSFAGCRRNMLLIIS
jgi:hypothetical protein